MDKLSDSKITRLLIAAFSSVQVMLFAVPSQASQQKDCLPVARSLESKKPYCAHELKGLKQEKARNQNAGILCFIVNKIIPLNQLLNLDQCVSKDAANQFDAKGQRIIPKIKGATEKFAILQPLGNTLISAQPNLTWKSIENANYRVTLTQGGEWLWSQTTDDSSVRIQHELTAGQVYTINVVALVNDQPVSEDSKALKLADSSILKGIDQTLVEVHGDSSDPLAEGMDKAMLLYHAELWDSAVEQLQALTSLQEPDVYRQLALIYQESGQGDLAMEYRQKALELANRKNKPMSRN